MKRNKRGYTRNLGRKADGNQHKVYFGHDREQAVLREKRLIALWNHIQKWSVSPERVWTQEYIDVGKAIAKGEAPEIPARPYELPDEYVARINDLKKEIGEDYFHPKDAKFARLDGDTHLRGIGLEEVEAHLDGFLRLGVGTQARQFQ